MNGLLSNNNTFFDILSSEEISCTTCASAIISWDQCQDVIAMGGGDTPCVTCVGGFVCGTTCVEVCMNVCNNNCSGSCKGGCWNICSAVLVF